MVLLINLIIHKKLKEERNLVKILHKRVLVCQAHHRTHYKKHRIKLKYTCKKAGKAIKTIDKITMLKHTKTISIILENKVANKAVHSKK